MKTSASITIALALLPAALAGCGGGGGAVTPYPPATPFAVAAANHLLLTAGGTWRMSGSASDGSGFNVEVSFTPLADGVFPLTGAPAAREQQTASGSLAGNMLSKINSVSYFNPGNDALIGDTNSGDGSCGRVTSNTALTSCSPDASPASTNTTTWSLETDRGVTLLCLNTSTVDLRTPSDSGTVSYCVETAPDGTLGDRARISISLLDGSFSLVARNY